MKKKKIINFPPYTNEDGSCAYCGFNQLSEKDIDNLRIKINEILDRQEFEVNEPPLNRKEIIEEITNLF